MSKATPGKDRQAPISTKLPGSTIDQLERAAALTGRPKNDLINAALLLYLPGVLAAAAQPGSLFDGGQQPCTE